ncbi:MAG: precorrin-2 C(20)-methyltransferase [bacterium]
MNPASGTLYGIGVGPGDPELLTLKALRLIHDCQVLAWPAPESGTGLAWEIVRSHLREDSTQERLPLRMPISVDPFPAQQAYDESARLLDRELRSGKSVGVLCEGDPLFYGSFMYLLERLSGSFPVEVIPGVSSPMACAAAARWPMAFRSEPWTVLPGTLPEDELRQRLRQPGAFALMKVGRHFSKLQRVLEELGLAQDAIYVEHASRPDQKVEPLHEVEAQEVPYFSMILLRNA